MKKIALLLLTLTGILMVTESSAQRGRKGKLETEIDSISYALGISIAKSVQQQEIPDINLDQVLKSLEAVLNNQETIISAEESKVLLKDYLYALKEKRDMEKLEKMAKFLDDNKKDPLVVTLASGLQYKVLKEGEGQSPTPKSIVKTHYKGTLMDGTEFDSSYGGDPIEFGVNRVIRGWQEALVLMKPGAKWILYVPPYLGYGDRNSGPIPANSVLIFEIELLSFK